VSVSKKCKFLVAKLVAAVLGKTGFDHFGLKNRLFELKYTKK